MVSKISVGVASDSDKSRTKKKVTSITRGMVRILCALIMLVMVSTLLLLYIDFFVGLF